jgi:hypothetical protein
MSWLAPSGVIGRLGNRHRPGRAGPRLLDARSAAEGRLQHNERYETVMASDVDRDGMYLELWERSPPRELALWAFYSDADGSFEFGRYRDDVPPEQEARRRLPPMTDA